jgi:hypothetical protein
MEDRNIKNDTGSHPTVPDEKFSHLHVFNNNHHFAFIYRKTEKLVTAVYMITNFIKDTEPLKWSVREKALSLMSRNLAITTASLSDRKNLLKEYQALSIEIVSLSGIGFHSGLISEMNFLILKREFEALVDIIQNEESKKKSEETVMLSSSFFDTGNHGGVDSLKQTETINSVNNPVEKKEPFYKGHVEPTKNHFVKTQVKKEVVKDKKIGGVVEEKKNGRQDTIVNLLHKKQGLNIKDFSEVISGCSEKTIQRELLAMVENKTLRKEGERRWSKYYLI